MEQKIETIDDYISLIVKETYPKWYYYLYDFEGNFISDEDDDDPERTIIEHIQNGGSFGLLPASMHCAVFSLRGGKVKSVTDKHGSELLVTRNAIGVMANVWYRYHKTDGIAEWEGIKGGRTDFRIGDAYGTLFVWGGDIKITKYHLIYFYLYAWRADDHKFRTFQIYEEGKGCVGVKYIFNFENGQFDWSQLYPEEESNETLRVKVETHWMDTPIDISEYFDRPVK